MPRSSSHRSPSSSYSRESSVFQDPTYRVYYGSDLSLQFEPPAGSKELAVALSYKFPTKGSIEGMMQAAFQEFLRDEKRKSRGPSKSGSRGRSTTGRLPQSEESSSSQRSRISRSSAPKVSEPPPLPPRVSVSKSDEHAEYTSSGKHRSQRAASSHVEVSIRKSSHVKDTASYSVVPDERPARPSYGTSLGVPTSSSSRVSKSTDSHRRRRASSSEDEADLKILSWNPEVQGFKEKQKKRRYGDEEKEQVRANRGHACEEHRRRRVKCDPEVCPNNGQAVKKRESRARRSQGSNRPLSADTTSSAVDESHVSSNMLGQTSTSFQSPTLIPGYTNSQVHASSENPNNTLTPYPINEFVSQDFSSTFNQLDSYDNYTASNLPVTVSNQDVYLATDHLPLPDDPLLDPNWMNDQYLFDVPTSEVYSNNYQSYMDPTSQFGLPQEQFYDANFTVKESDYAFMHQYSGSRDIGHSNRPRSVHSDPHSNQGLSSSTSSRSTSRGPISPTSAPRRKDHSPSGKRRPRSPGPRRREHSHKREESPPTSTWQNIKSLATEVSELPKTYKRRPASTYGSRQLDVPSGSSRSRSSRRSGSPAGSEDIDDMSSKLSSWLTIK
ncbi:hypothetical protein HYFRA_00009272 [Hymenoscyphus fraxineus]|uniref:Uncharacterized protein n=1 Tax=Hymenoscyphus fraxineus TaxID=746836 RepID=A0A9N9KZR5_9HELO|nr:hypothetical protein HYFRA_00009272 [Hymenoscyphus fraxineus]